MIAIRALAMVVDQKTPPRFHLGHKDAVAEAVSSAVTRLQTRPENKDACVKIPNTPTDGPAEKAQVALPLLMQSPHSAPAVGD